MPTRANPPRRYPSTMKSAKASTSSMRRSSMRTSSLPSAADSVTMTSRPGEVGSAAGTSTRSKSARSRLWVMRNRSSPPMTACSTLYSTPSVRGQISCGSASRSSALMLQYPVVVFDPVTTNIIRPEREKPDPTKKRSSGSWKMHTSSLLSVPTTWRHTFSGRQASSTVV